jgi:hypothetical protein
VGSYPVTAGTLALNGGAGANYNFNPASNFTAGSLSVTPAALTVAVADNAKFVFQNDPSPISSVSYSGFVNGDSVANARSLVAPTLTRATAGNTTAGTYPITAAGASAADYNIVYQYTQGASSYFVIAVPDVAEPINYQVINSNNLTVAKNVSSVMTAGTADVANASVAVNQAPRVTGSYGVVLSEVNSAGGINDILSVSRTNNMDYDLSTRVLRDGQNDTLKIRYAIVMADGSPVPGWLNFDAENGTVRASGVSADSLPIRFQVRKYLGDDLLKTNSFVLDKVKLR